MTGQYSKRVWGTKEITKIIKMNSMTLRGLLLIIHSWKNLIVTYKCKKGAGII